MNAWTLPAVGLATAIGFLVGICLGYEAALQSGDVIVVERTVPPRHAHEDGGA